MDEPSFMGMDEIESLREEADNVWNELVNDPFVNSMEPSKKLFSRITQEVKRKGICYEETPVK